MFTKKRKRDTTDDEYDRYGFVKDSIPWDKKSNKPYKKSYRKPKSSKSVINYGPSIIPDVYTTKMTYTSNDIITSTSGAIGTKIFRGNSLFDPDLTGVGTQPAGFDELSALYLYYRVSASSIEIQACTSVVTQQDDLVIFPANNTTVLGSTNDVRGETPYATRRIGVFNQSTPSVKKYMTTSKIWGVSKEQVKTDDTYSASITQNPVSPWYWIINYQDLLATNTQGCSVVSKITYYVSFFGRKPLNKS